ncbi:MAG: response regulator, partial [bacterium]|nr:response regulator [bacterium]
METKILIVEDEAIIAEDMKTSLQGINYQVTGIASSGREALRAVATNIPDLILMDIKLYGDMDGIEVTERIHRDHDIPVVYLTAFADEETLGRVKRSGP